MHTDRSAIFSLVASGRITPREAERLLAVSRDGEDTIRLALCLAFLTLALPLVANGVATIGQTLVALLPAIERALLSIGGMA